MIPLDGPMIEMVNQSGNRNLKKVPSNGMSFEARRYRQLRWAVLGFGLVIFGGLTLLSAIQIRTIWPFVRPSVLDCGCQLVRLELGPGTWILTAGLLGLTMLLSFRWLWSFTRTIYRSYRWQQARLHSNGQWLWHRQLGQPYFLYASQQPEAMTAGYFRPKIFLSRAMLRTLSGSEVTAVLRHEQAHCRRRDPLWAALLESIGATFGWPSWLRAWVNASYSYREIAADGDATGNYQSTEAISGAILKLVATGDVAPRPAFSPNGDRVEKLINPTWHPSHRLWHWRYAVALSVLLMSLTLLATLTVTSAAELPKVPTGICQQQTLMCAGPTMPTQTVVCREQHGWQCVSLRGSFPISLDDGFNGFR